MRVSSVFAVPAGNSLQASQQQTAILPRTRIVYYPLIGAATTAPPHPTFCTSATHTPDGSTIENSRVPHGRSPSNPFGCTHPAASQRA
jgi:hypothetical protein